MIKKFLPNLFVSGRDEVYQKEELQRLGINAILNVAWEVDDPQYAPQDFLMLKIGLLDSSENPGWLKDMAAITLQNLLENDKTVLVHCMAGASRSAYFAIRYISEKEHRTMEALYNEYIATFPPGSITVSPLNYVI